MEPRCLPSGWTSDGLTFLGGTNEFDLWFDDTQDVRVVWGAKAAEWDWFYWSRAREKYEWGTEDTRNVNHNKVLVEALTYLRIFAPWVEEEMTKGTREYHRE